MIPRGKGKIINITSLNAELARANISNHSVLSYDVTAEQMRDWCRMMDIEFVHINKDTTLEKLEEQLFLADLAWKLK